MRAARMTSYGPPELLTVAEVPAPRPGVGEVAVNVAVAAVNFPDLLIMSGGYQASWPLPLIPGSEFAGTVAATGPGVTGLAPGDRVAGTVAVGAFAERVVAPAGALWRVPDGADLAAAAAFRVTYLTSYHALRSVAGVRKGDWVVVLGAAGGVGLAAVDIARLRGARVIAAASGQDKLAVCRARGADEVVDYARDDLKNAIKRITGSGADVVIDPVGGRHSEQALRATAWGGRFVCLGFASGEIPRIPLNLVLLKGVVVQGLEIRTFGDHRPELAARDEAELAGHFAAARLRPCIGARYELADTAAALAAVRNRKTYGKVVIMMSGPAGRPSARITEV
jgi:NADPH2:quinone reductase